MAIREVVRRVYLQAVYHSAGIGTTVALIYIRNAVYRHVVQKIVHLISSYTINRQLYLILYNFLSYVNTEPFINTYFKILKMIVETRTRVVEAMVSKAIIR